MDLQQRFTDEQLHQIVEEASIYMCACPGQVANELRQLRHLIRYQRDCITEGKTLSLVHQTIAAAGREAHAVMENCLDRVLEIEGWDRTTLKMPAGLRKLRDDILAGDP
ncbi:MAG: hypothetical protein ACK4FP_13900 [Azonexus sp.]